MVQNESLSLHVYVTIFKKNTHITTVLDNKINVA